MIELYRFYAGNKEWRYTNSQEDVIFNNKVYKAIPISRSEFQHTVKKNTIKIRMPYDIEPAILFKGFQIAHSLWLDIVRFPEGLYIFVGKAVGCKIKLEKAIAELTVASLQTVFSGQIPRRVFSRTCTWNLYDENCGVNKNDYRISIKSNEVSVTGTSLSHPAIASKPDQWFTGGYVECGYETSFILQHTGSTVKLMYPLQTISENQYIHLYAGCNKTKDTCRNKFNNEINFGGFPFIPSENAAKGGFDFG